MSSPEALAALANLLREHLNSSLDPHELEMTRRTLELVESNPRCLERALETGHLTGSAWIVDPARQRTLLTHHRKLDKWLQLGGHADGDPDLLNVALREAREEGGIFGLRPVTSRLFDVDCHWIPPRQSVPGHWHHDLRFMIEADPLEPLVISDESHDLAWVPLETVADLNPDESMVRMVRKTWALGRT
jgi:8-oxo-dGTP pyrophosphatase MutT (NUDIX family)